MLTHEKNKTAILSMPATEFLEIPEVWSQISGNIRGALWREMRNKTVNELRAIEAERSSPRHVHRVNQRGVEQVRQVLAKYGIEMLGPGTSATQHDSTPDETIIKMSPRKLTMTFGDKVDPDRKAAFEKEFVALAAKHFGPSDDTDAAAAPTAP